MIITKANAKENLGDFICLSITKAKAKTNPQILISHRFRADGKYRGNGFLVHWALSVPKNRHCSWGVERFQQHMHIEDEAWHKLSKGARRKLDRAQASFGSLCLRRVRIKPVGRIFEISDSNQTVWYQENAENAEGPLSPEKRVGKSQTLRAQRLKKFKIALRDWNFQSRLKISSEPPSKPLVFFVGNSESQDWNFQSRLKISSEIEFFQSLGP